MPGMHIYTDIIMYHNKDANAHHVLEVTSMSQDMTNEPNDFDDIIEYIVEDTWPSAFIDAVFLDKYS